MPIHCRRHESTQKIRKISSIQVRDALTKTQGQVVLLFIDGKTGTACLLLQKVQGQKLGVHRLWVMLR